jgi:hypothetical protein
MIRASSVTLACKCNASTAAGDEVRVDLHDPTADTGTEVHRAIALRLQGKPVEPFAGINAGENEDMVELALAWFQTGILAGPHKPLTIETEVSIRATSVSGTLDVLVLHSLKRAAVIDWKTTYRDDDHTPQVMAYAWLAFQRQPELEVVDVWVAYLRREGADHKMVTREYAESWMNEFERNTLEHPDVFTPGEHCGRCPRQLGCPALVAMNRQTAITLLDTAGQQIVSREGLAALKPRVAMIEAAIKAYKDILRAEVLTNGPIPTTEGKQLAKLTKHIDHIHPFRGWAILQAEFSDEEIARFLVVKKTEMLTVIGDRTAKGKAKEQERIMESLRAAGAVSVDKQVEVREVKVH